MNQTITVSVKQQGEKTALCIDNKEIAEISKDYFHKGRFSASLQSGSGGCCSGATYPEAVEFISGCIERFFADLGLNVEFK